MERCMRKYIFNIFNAGNKWKNQLKIDDYDSMSGEHVSVNSEMIFTSVRSGFFHWKPLKIKDL
jgi:hypothetical protein